MKFCIVIPAYNEEKRIGRTLEAYGSYFEDKNDNEYEILVSINNTTDRTEEIVKKYSKKYKNIRYINLKKGGKGYAIVEGWKDALKRKNDFLGFVDADMATSPEEFYKLVKNIEGADGIIANRYIKGSIVKPKQSFFRIFASRVFNLLVRTYFLFPYTDTQCGAKLFTRKAIEKAANGIGMTKWAFDIELLYILHKRGFRIRQVPTGWSDIKDSKLDIKKASIQMFFAISQLRIIKSPFRRLLHPFKPLIGILWGAVSRIK